MIVGIMSDTHDRLPLIDEAVKRMNAERVDLVLHSGDYISPFVVSHFKPLKAKIIGVFGNNDAELGRLKSLFAEIGARVKGRFAEVKVEGIKIAVLHGEEDELLNSLIEGGCYEVIVHGHTHEASIRREGETLVINPGEVCGYLSGKSTVAKLDTETLKAEIIPL
ncbi:MAG: phosphodiesterase [Candidatus Bathyarchaeota archaeon B26-2]|nr:MAG: phosphodiesterase [Candidatus Bathyarchaeota archaeon B26-2]